MAGRECLGNDPRRVGCCGIDSLTAVARAVAAACIDHFDTDAELPQSIAHELGFTTFRVERGEEINSHKWDRHSCLPYSNSWQAGMPAPRISTSQSPSSPSAD